MRELELIFPESSKVIVIEAIQNFKDSTEYNRDFSLENHEYAIRDLINPRSIYDALGSYCKIDKLTINDSFSTRKYHDGDHIIGKFFNISNFSILNPEIGKGIFRHEIAHAIDRIFKDDIIGGNSISDLSHKAHADLLSCITNQHLNRDSLIDDFQSTYELRTGKEYKIDYNYHTYENYADVISAMSSDSKDVNEKCLVFTKLDGKYYEVKGQKIELSEAGFDNSEITSGQANNLFRLLNVEVQKGNLLPSSCQELINENRDLFQFKKCI